MDTTTLMTMINDLRLLAFDEGCLWITRAEGELLEDLDAQYGAKQKEIAELLLEIQSIVSGEESVSV